MFIERRLNRKTCKATLLCIITAIEIGVQSIPKGQVLQYGLQQGDFYSPLLTKYSYCGMTIEDRINKANALEKLNREKLWELSDFLIILLTYFLKALSFSPCPFFWCAIPTEDTELNLIQACIFCLLVRKLCVCKQLSDGFEVLRPDLMPSQSTSTCLWL